MLVYNKCGILSSEWYRKPTDTGLTLNFHSLAPFKYKKSVMIGFVYRIYRSCSSWRAIHKGLEEAKTILLRNQYPLHTIETIFKETIHKLLGNEDIENERSGLELDENACLLNVQEKDKFKFFLNYRGKPSEKFAQSLRKLNAPCKVIMTLVKTKNIVSKLKPPVPNMLQSNVVYKITCPRCKSSYVGQTSRHMQQRFREHIGARGLIKIHFIDCNVEPREDTVEILGRAKGEKLLTLESLFISEISPNLNTKDEFRSRELKLKF